MNIEESHQKFPRLDVIPFESHHQYMATMNNQGDGNPPLIYLKGAVEVILERCSAAIDPANRSIELDSSGIIEKMDRMASKGLRVLAFAKCEGQVGKKYLDHEDVASGLTFLGLQGMIDPPRAEAVAAVKTCHDAGIRVKMITGDHAVTAAAIAKHIGLFASVEGEMIETTAVTGKTLSSISDEELIELVDRSAVFARVSPETKTAPGGGHTSAGAGCGHDRRWGQRRPSAEKGRHRGGHGNHWNRRGQRGGPIWC